MDHRCPADCSPVLSWTPLKSQYIYIFYVLICPQTNIDTSLNKKQQIHHIRVDMQCWGNSSRPASAEMCGRLNTAPNHLHPYCPFLRTICLLMEACSKHTDLHLSMIATIKGWMSSDGGSYTQSQLFCFFRSVFFPFSPPGDLSAAGDQIKLGFLASHSNSRWSAQLAAWRLTPSPTLGL